MKEGIEIKVFGKVQGVWFRGSTQERAQAFQLTGWVHNEPDGYVLIRAFGKKTDLEKFQEWCATGPLHARVDRIEVQPIDTEDYPTFEIRRK
ncbi:MAG: acylphosphatase [Saprospiraceae bacterium]|nr:acylphosphatase [Saprospiraceae bacterium]